MQAAFGDHPKYFELVDGRRYAKVSPQRTHGLLQGWIYRRIAEAAGDRGEVAIEWKFYLGGKPGAKNALQPDVSFVSRERLAELTLAQAEKPRFAPDVAVEVLSPDDRPGLLHRKIARYLGKGAQLIIVIDPEKRNVVAHTADGIESFSDHETFCSAAASWLRFDVSELFDAARWREK